jgi:hypothetical protein
MRGRSVPSQACTHRKSFDRDIIDIKQEIAFMTRTRASLATAVLLAGMVISGAVLAQTPAPAIAPAPAPSAKASSEPSAAKKVETWTKKQWNAAQKEWAKDKTKWANCRNQSKAQKLTGRKSWSFLYECMTG